nr:MAG TPA: hypothetical protein [Caudoviricetes sp.]
MSKKQDILRIVNTETRITERRSNCDDQERI